MADDRITSYNVCYTKLLRESGAGRREAQGRSLRARCRRDGSRIGYADAVQACQSAASGRRAGDGAVVITSYSIHYTKLYEL